MPTTPAAPAPPLGVDPIGCAAGFLQGLQRIVLGRPPPCEIKNNSTSTIYLTPKSHPNGDTRLEGHPTKETLEIPLQGSIRVDSSDYNLDDVNAYSQIVIYLSLDRKGIPFEEGGLLFYHHELPQGDLLNLTLEGRRVIRTDGGQQLRADHGSPNEGTVTSRDGGQQDGANGV